MLTRVSVYVQFIHFCAWVYTCKMCFDVNVMYMYKNCTLGFLFWCVILNYTFNRIHLWYMLGNLRKVEIKAHFMETKNTMKAGVRLNHRILKTQPFWSCISPSWFGQINCPFRRLISIVIQFYQAYNLGFLQWLQPELWRLELGC